MKKRIILDYLRRWKWFFIGGFGIHLCLMSLAWDDPDKVFPVAVFAGSGFLLLVEIIRSGGARTHLTLPVTAGQLARSWRFVALEFPAGLFLVALVLSACFASTEHFSWERFLILGLFQTLLLGVVFFAETGLPHGPAEQSGLRDLLRNSAFGLPLGFSIPISFMFGSKIPMRFADFSDWQLVVMSGLLALTIAGWFRAEVLVRRRAQLINRAGPSRRLQSSTEPRVLTPEDNGFGGVPYFCFHMMRMIGGFGLLIVLFNWGASEIIFRKTVGDGDFNRDFSLTIVKLFAPYLALAIAGAALVQLRLLRSLPLSGAQIAGLLVLWPMAAGLIFGGTLLVFYRLFYGGPMLWGHLVWLTAVTLPGVPVVLRLGFTLKGLVAIMVLLLLVQSTMIFDDRFEFDFSRLWPLALVLMPLSFMLSRRLLDSSHPWRAGAMRWVGVRRT